MRPSAQRAGRSEYEQIRRQIQQADVVNVDETGIKRDGDQAWLWTFRTDTHTLYAVRESRGHDVPAEVLGEDFTGTIICDGWTAYPAFSKKLQRCWAHILREAEDAAEQQEEGEPISRALTQLYVALQTQLDSDLALHERAELQRVARRELESLIERSRRQTTLRKTRYVNQSFFGRSSGRLGNVRPRNHLIPAGNAEQQGRNPYEEFKRVIRDNEMISRPRAVPVVESAG